MDMLTKKNYATVRMGAVVEKKLNTKNKKIIDYANSSSRSDFMDVFLGAHCEFFICSDTGISIIPEIFHKPMVYVNWSVCCILPMFMKTAILIPKKIYSQVEDRVLTFKEIIQSDVGSYTTSEQFQKMKLKIIEHTQQEISQAVNEMHTRLQKCWEEDKNDTMLQQKFWSLYNHPIVRSDDFLIGAEFLRDNQDLLE